MDDLTRARQLLTEGRTLVLVKGEEAFIREERGIRPLLTLLEEGKREGWSAADRAVGKAAAFLYVLLGVKAVYAGVLSKSAEEVLRAGGIFVEADTRCERIRNRAGDGFCPMETAVGDIHDPLEAVSAIKAALSRMKGS